MRKNILLTVLLIIGVLIMLKPVSAIIKDSQENIIYRGNVVTGTVATDNGNGSYDVYIGESAEAYPNIFTLAENPDLVVGDKVRILYENGIKELPIILPPRGTTTPDTPDTPGLYLYSMEYPTVSGLYVMYLVKRNLSDLSVVNKVALEFKDDLTGYSVEGEFAVEGDYIYGVPHTFSDNKKIAQWYKETGELLNTISLPAGEKLAKYSGFVIVGSNIFTPNDDMDKVWVVSKNMSGTPILHPVPDNNFTPFFGLGSDGTYLYGTGWNNANHGVNTKYNVSFSIVWSREHTDPINDYGHKLGASTYGFAIRGSDGSNIWIRTYDLDGNFKKQKSSPGTMAWSGNGIKMDNQGNVYLLDSWNTIIKYDSDLNEVCSTNVEGANWDIETTSAEAITIGN